MKKIIVYYPFKLNKVNSGSSVRPIRILESFRQFGKRENIEIIEVTGDGKTRKQKLKKMFNNINPKDILFCYMESSTLPFWLTDRDHIPRTPFLELKFFKMLNKHNIPLGIFYRDAYWMFNEYSLKGIKRALMRIVYRLEKYLFKKYSTHIFLPSMEMNRYTKFPEEKMSSLPPAGNNNTGILKWEKDQIYSAVYVGGLSPAYGIDNLLKAFDIINKNKTIVKLSLVCRKNEYSLYNSLFDNYRESEWLQIYHLSGEDLKTVYSHANFALLPLSKTVYNDFAVPVKLFEYLSYGLPIIATNCEVQKKIIENIGSGLISKDSPDSLVENIRKILNRDLLEKFKKEAERSLLERNLWLHRIEEIYDKLYL